MTMGVEKADLFNSRLSVLHELSDSENKRAFLAAHPDLVTPEVVQRLVDSARQLLQTDVTSALNRSETAVAIAESLGANESLASALRSKANALRFQGQCRPAVDLLERAAELFEQAGRIDELGRTLSTSVQPLILLGDYSRALENVARAKEIFSRQNDRLRLARLELNATNIDHRQERFAEALARYERVLPELLEQRDTEGIGVALHNMSVCLISLNEFDRALNVYEQARNFFQRNEMPGLESQADYNIAYLYYLRGEYERAISGLCSARETYSTNGDAYHTALCDLDLSEIYLELNLIEEAERMARNAAHRFEQLGMGYEAARSITNLAIANSRKNDRDEALKLLTRAKRIFATEEHRAGESLVDLYQAILLFEAEDLEAARSLCEKAGEFFRASGLIRKAVVCDLLLSRLALAKDDLSVARERCEEALDRLRTLEAPVLSYHAYFQAGQVSEALGEAKKSAAAYHVARRHLDNLRSSLQGEELRIAFMSDRLDVYERLVHLCLTRALSGPPAEEAFGYMEQAKSRSLLDSIFGRAQPLPARAVAEERVETEIHRVRGELNWYYHRIEAEQFARDGVSGERIAKLWEQARGCEDRLLQKIREIPGLPVEARNGSDPSVASAAKIQAALGRDSVLVEYFQIGDRLLAAVLTSTSADIVPLTTMQRVRDRLRMLQFQISKFRAGSLYTENLKGSLKLAADSHLQELYREIVWPLRHLLIRDHIVWVPHGILHYVPFHALYDGNEYLIDRFTVSYAPSAGIYELCQTTSPAREGQSLVLGVSDPKAPWILAELLEVAAVVPNACLLVDADASKKSLRELGAQSRQIHVATHGFFRRDNPMFSGVRLGDGYLSLYDLYSFRLPVDLLTLSGCATGLNVVAAGDELIGLARGLLYAGARTLLLSLWDVHDRSTAEFMRSFYAHAHNGMVDKASALRAAMLETRGQYPHPFHWAPFILLGKARG